MTEDFVIENGVLKEYTGPGGDVAVPAGVTEIGRRAFYQMKDLDTVTIPEGVVHIREGAFQYSSLRHVVLPDSLEEMGRDDPAVSLGVFDNCASLESVVIPEGIRHLRWHTFQMCTGLQSVSLPKGLLSIGVAALSDCRALCRIDLPEGLEVIARSAFSGDKLLEDFTIPKSVQEIGIAAFGHCASLTRMEIPEGITVLNDLLFHGCTSLREVVIPPGVQDLGSGVFHGCTALPGVELPEGVPVLRSCLFKDCAALRSLRIPESVQEIRFSAFEGCTALEEITIPAGVAAIGEEAFKDCTALKQVTILGKNVKFSASAFQNTDAEIIVDSLPLGKLPKNVREYTLFCFAQKHLSGLDIPAGHKTQCLKYIRRMGAKLFPLAEKYPVILALLLREKAIKAEDVPELIRQTENEETAAALESYLAERGE